MTDERAERNVEFETVRSEKIPFGKSNFIEIARKKAISKDGEESEFISISRGYTLRDGTERYKKSVTIPDETEIKEFIANQVSSI
ncbi:hypothetical protein [Candidatus Methanomassiliicoccus intestinalis]|jgi:hypothetical protein|uniref:Uncharacterized protein n=2 Tax=Candidatus Methanomassiliicoccus intestinalis TaxID=1406512 RepID=R9T816_METII|nr:hypothetical protein [Candidatus Methanomassiliicoccus intestinalis]AGN27077.1 hypothetical protein MMINT_17920 [Candidatus Methanomassiliicoccus intestinalis Issoire-Mx1]TQS80952.1 MAG: hypothetical protein A3206_04465 [Candidatus Methanomassiliicoccus intestinalis]TQS83944.1 MAG: hypothetical protein A3207_06350 [Candidatus Methanomassiliicoccus intestinalis]